MAISARLGWSLGLGGLAASAAVLAAVAASWWARGDAGGRRRGGGHRDLPGGTGSGGRVGNHLDAQPAGVARAAWLYNQSILAPVARTHGADLSGGRPDRVACGCEHAAQDARRGGGRRPRRWTQLWRIALPCRAAVIVVAWLVAMALALGELAASVLVTPAGVTPFRSPYSVCCTTASRTRWPGSAWRLRRPAGRHGGGGGAVGWEAVAQYNGFMSTKSLLVWFPRLAAVANSAAGGWKRPSTNSFFVRIVCLAAATNIARPAAGKG